MQWLASVKSISRPISVFAITLVLSLSLGISSWMFKHNAETGNREIGRNIEKITAELDLIRADQEAIAQYFDEFLQLKSTGIVGKEQRLLWTETVKLISRDMNIENLQYAILRQQTANHEPMPNTGPYQLMSSTMKISAKLHHVVELLSFFDKLRSAQIGVFNFNQCELNLLPFDHATLPKDPMVQAECELEWLTLEPRTL